MGQFDDLPKKIGPKKFTEIVTKDPIFAAMTKAVEILKKKLTAEEQKRFDEINREIDELVRQEPLGTDDDARKFMARFSFLVQESWNLLNKKEDPSTPQ